MHGGRRVARIRAHRAAALTIELPACSRAKFGQNRKSLNRPAVRLNQLAHSRIACGEIRRHSSLGIKLQFRSNVAKRRNHFLDRVSLTHGVFVFPMGKHLWKLPQSDRFRARLLWQLVP